VRGPGVVERRADGWGNAHHVTAGDFLPFKTLLFVVNRLKATFRHQIREEKALDK